MQYDYFWIMISSVYTLWVLKCRCHCYNLNQDHEKVLIVLIIYVFLPTVTIVNYQNFTTVKVQTYTFSTVNFFFLSVCKKGIHELFHLVLFRILKYLFIKLFLKHFKHLMQKSLTFVVVVIQLYWGSHTRYKPRSTIL